jgi:hypothetical protein
MVGVDQQHLRTMAKSHHVSLRRVGGHSAVPAFVFSERSGGHRLLKELSQMVQECKQR